MDRNDQLKGIHWLDQLYQAILKKVVLRIEYHSFKAREKSALTVYPKLLKEFNNRWFLICKKTGSKGLLTLALDRIQSINYDLKSPFKDFDFDPDTYYKNCVGVTTHEGNRPCIVKLLFDRHQAPYVITKPLHHSQQVGESNEDGEVLIIIKVIQNFELERLILGFGDGVKVIGPKKLRERMINKIKHMTSLYGV